MNTHSSKSKALVGISACLLGHEVRFNGGHSRNRYVTDVLDAFCEWVPVCPEVEMGMPTPRETIRLVGDVDAPRLVGSKSGIDYTDQMKDFAKKKISHLKDQNLHGFILKSKSPSCGLERLPVYNDKAGARPLGRGLFAAALREELPLLPMEEDGRLFDNKLRDHFLRKLYAYQRWCSFKAEARSVSDLVNFHTRHKLLLSGHHMESTQELGRLVAEANAHPFHDLLSLYGALFMKCLERPCTRRSQAHTLLKLASKLKLPMDDLGEISEMVKLYKMEHMPLAVPVTLISHHLRKKPDVWRGIPFYLNPYPSAAAGPCL